MAWTTPRTWTTGELVTAAIMNAHVRDNLLWLLGGCVLLQPTADVTVNDSGADYNFIIEGDTDANLFTLDAGTNRIGISEAAPNSTLDVNGTTRLGDSDTNYAAFAADGELTLAGTARVKKEFQIETTSLAPGGTGPDATILGNYLGYSYDIGDDSVTGFEIPDDWDASTNLEVYIYWYINEAYATASGEVQWRIQWSACPTDASEAVDAPTHTGTIDYGDQNIPATAKTLTKTTAGVIAVASLAAGDMIGMTIDRVALDDGTDPTADPVIVRVEVEYTANKLGEAT